MIRICKLFLVGLDASLVIGDGILICCARFSFRTKIKEMNGRVLPEGYVHLRDVPEPIDVEGGAQF